jgi:hypothetical protein
MEGSSLLGRKSLWDKELAYPKTEAVSHEKPQGTRQSTLIPRCFGGGGIMRPLKLHAPTLPQAARYFELLAIHLSEDMIGVSKTVYRLKTGGTWRLAEVTAKVRKPLAKAGIGCLNERS